MRRSFVKRLREKLEATLTAAAFAEESEGETAKRIVMDEALLSLAAKLSLAQGRARHPPRILREVTVGTRSP